MEHHPEPYTLLPESKHTHTIILLHGTSMTGPKFAGSFLDYEFSLDTPLLPNTNNSNNNQQLSEAPETTLRRELGEKGCLAGLKLIFPTGSLKKLTVFQGREMNAWFDIHDFSDRTIGEKEQVLGMRESLIYLKKLVEDEGRVLENVGGEGLESGRRRGGGGGGGGKKGKLVLGGFSQGTAMGIVGLLSGELEVDAFVGLSGWLPFRKQVDRVLGVKKKEVDVEKVGESKERKGIVGWIWNLFLGFLRRVSWLLHWVLRRYISKPAKYSGEKQEMGRRRDSVVRYFRNLLSLPARNVEIDPTIPTLLGHGMADQKVKYEWGLQLRDSLMNMGWNLKSRSYEGIEHWYCEEEMRDLVVFLKDVCRST